MANSITQIYDQIVAEKQNQPELQALQPNIDNSQTLLNDLTTTSKVAHWRLIYWVYAVAIWLQQKYFDQHKADVELIIINKTPPTILWFRQLCFDWQYGDNLLLINNRFQYQTINETKKIIRRAAATEADGRVVLKIAELSGTDIIPLDANKLNAFKSYIAKVKPAGTRMRFISETADLLHINGIVYYDPLVINSTGESIANGNKPVEDAINNYIKNLPFNGQFNNNALIDAIQAIVGVVNFKLNISEAKYGDLTYQLISLFYNSNAGHLTIDPALPLSTELTYEPYNM